MLTHNCIATALAALPLLTNAAPAALVGGGQPDTVISTLKSDVQSRDILSSIPNLVPGIINSTSINSIAQINSVISKIETSLNSSAEIYAAEAALLEAIVSIETPASTSAAITEAGNLLGNATSGVTLFNIAQSLLEGVSVTDLTQNVLAGYGLSNINSYNNVNPAPAYPIYPYKSRLDAPYSVPEANLRAAMYFPPGFDFSATTSKRPVLFVPGTGAFGGVNFISNLGKLLSPPYNTDYAPVYLNVPGAMYDDTQVNAEYIAYAMNYISSFTTPNTPVTSSTTNTGRSITNHEFADLPRRDRLASSASSSYTSTSSTRSSTSSRSSTTSRISTSSTTTHTSSTTTRTSSSSSSTATAATVSSPNPQSYNLAVIGWSQANPDTQWAYQYWPSTRPTTSDFISCSADFHGTVLAYLLQPVPGTDPVPPSILQQEYNSNYITTLRNGGGASPYVPSTSIWSITDEIVEPQASPDASAMYTPISATQCPNNSSSYELYATPNGENQYSSTNNQLQTLCPAQPAGGLYTHEGVLYNPVTYALVIDALTHAGPGQSSRIDLATLCQEVVAPGLSEADVLATEGLIPLAAVNLALYPQKVTVEPPIMAYATSGNEVGRSCVV